MLARVLAAAMNPARAALVQIRQAEAQKTLRPLDARLIAYLMRNDGTIGLSDWRAVTDALDVPSDDLERSFTRLVAGGFALDARNFPSGLLALDGDFLRAVAD